MKSPFYPRRSLLLAGLSLLCLLVGGCESVPPALALHQAAAKGEREKTKSLITQGADINFADSQGNTPLHLAASGGHDGVVRILLSKGASVSARNALGRTPLHEAATAGHKKTARELLLGGADPEARDNEGFTPIDHAPYRLQDMLLEVSRVRANKVGAPAAPATGTPEAARFPN